MDAPQTITQPPQTPPAQGPAIFVMPEAYRGGVGKLAQPKAPEPVKPASVVVVAPPPPPVQKPPAPVRTRRGLPKLLILLGVILIVVLGIGGYLLVRSSQPTTPVVIPPRPTPEPTPTPEPEPEPEPEPVVPTPGADTDGDGLTDIEEQLIYGSDVGVPDTDGDSYNDGLEVFNRYNPAGLAPRTLIEAGLARALTEGPTGPLPYTMLYPSLWAPTVDASANALFVASTGEQVTVRYGLRDGETIPAGGSVFTTKNGLLATRSTDGLTVYIPSGANTIVLTYVLGTKLSIDYTRTFEMMVNSVLLRQE